ncbi:glycoside-pentoside-hexuronide (GPH):cation symporter [Propionibacteriaceae bacterium Y2011]
MAETVAVTEDVAPQVRPLTAKNYLAYAAGDAAGNVCFTMAGMFLILYYTNVIGIAGGVIGTMFLALRFIDSVSDLVMGRIIDMKKPGKLGKFRPIILWFFGPLLIMNWLMYAAALIFPNQSTAFHTVYMYVTYFLMGSVFYTIVNIAYGAMAPSLTQVPTERGKLASFRMYGAAAMILALSWLIAPQIDRFEGDAQGLQNALALTVGLISVVAALLYLFMVWGTREQVYRDPEPVSVKESFGALLLNRPLQILSLGSVGFLTGMTVLSTLGSYVALYGQRSGTYIAVNATAQTAALFVVAPLVPVMVRTIGKKMGFILVGFAMYVGAAILIFSPLETLPWLGSVAFFVMGIGVYGTNTLMWALEADCVEYGEWKIGKRTEGTTYAVFSFMRKMGQALGGFIGGWALVWAGFVAEDVAAGAPVSAEVAGNIVLWAVVFVAGATLFGQIVMWFYPLTEARFQEIVAEIQTRRTERLQRQTDR